MISVVRTRRRVRGVLRPSVVLCVLPWVVVLCASSRGALRPSVVFVFVFVFVSSLWWSSEELEDVGLGS